MILKLNELRDKLAGCWTGKNVGGVLGAPFECKRMIPNVDFYVYHRYNFLFPDRRLI